MSGIPEKWREAKTDRERADIVFAFRQQVLKDKTLEEMQKALGVPTSVIEVFAAAQAAAKRLECGKLSGRCVLK
jgi:hypothetical protein